VPCELLSNALCLGVYGLGPSSVASCALHDNWPHWTVIIRIHPNTEHCWVAHTAPTTPWRWQLFAETCRGRIWNALIQPPLLPWASVGHITTKSTYIYEYLTTNCTETQMYNVTKFQDSIKTKACNRFRRPHVSKSAVWCCLQTQVACSNPADQLMLVSYSVCSPVTLGA
jgi:hypothetical protein